MRDYRDGMEPLARLLVALLLSLAVVACSDAVDEASTEVAPAPEAVAAIEDGATVIDVRTPQEYDEGHLPRARNIDVSADDFEQQIEELDLDDSYVVYCRTGSRAATAAETMVETGFHDVVNGGGYDDLVSAGAG